MPNPSEVVCTENTWVLVATNVIADNATLWRMNTVPTSYYYTYRLTGQAAPTLITEGVPIFRNVDPDFENISASGVDLYVYALDGEGRVRVDI